MLLIKRIDRCMHSLYIRTMHVLYRICTYQKLMNTFIGAQMNETLLHYCELHLADSFNLVHIQQEFHLREKSIRRTNLVEDCNNNNIVSDFQIRACIGHVELHIIPAYNIYRQKVDKIKYDQAKQLISQCLIDLFPLIELMLRG